MMTLFVTTFFWVSEPAHEWSVLFGRSTDNRFLEHYLSAAEAGGVDWRAWFRDLLLSLTGVVASRFGHEFVRIVGDVSVWWPCEVPTLPEPSLWEEAVVLVRPFLFAPVATGISDITATGASKKVPPHQIRRRANAVSRFKVGDAVMVYCGVGADNEVFAGVPRSPTDVISLFKRMTVAKYNGHIYELAPGEGGSNITRHALDIRSIYAEDWHRCPNPAASAHTALHAQTHSRIQPCMRPRMCDQFMHAQTPILTDAPLSTRRERWRRAVDENLNACEDAACALRAKLAADGSGTDVGVPVRINSTNANKLDPRDRFRILAPTGLQCL